MSLSVDPAERHRELASRFTNLVAGATDWTAPSPVAEWQAADVVEHLVEWLPGLLASGSDLRVPVDGFDRTNPLPAWEQVSAGVQAILDDPAAAESTFRSQMLPQMPVSQMLAQFWTPDVFMHSWDLAVATQQDDRLDPEYALELLDGFRTVEQMLRESGQFGVQQPVAPDAPVQAQLIAFIGRDPEWSAPLS